MNEIWSGPSFSRDTTKRNHGSSDITRSTMNSTTCRTNRRCRKTSRLWKKKLVHGKNFSRNFHPSVQIILAISLKSASTEMLTSCFFSWGIHHFELLEILMARLLSIGVSLFSLGLSKLCHQLRYDRANCHPSVRCISCSSIHKIQRRWKFTHPNEVLFSFYVLNGYLLPRSHPELPGSLINYPPARTSLHAAKSSLINSDFIEENKKNRKLPLYPLIKLLHMHHQHTQPASSELDI